ncbi:hypothetical protein F4778DRAFT_426935 [Xylariomycetidae sp. FL2044]|nr:hypothetical protein F4778DRAFT_426935 [Xylariomycetidae sp. FL2044]
MITLMIQQFCRSIRAPETVKRWRDAGYGCLIIFLSQLLVVPLQIALDLHSVNLPASILAMIAVAVVMLLANCINRDVAQFYTTHMRGPADFAGRHMSFGFVSAFLMLNRDHISDSLDIPRSAGAFFLTTLLGYVSAFACAAAGYKLEQCLRDLRRKAPDIENTGIRPQPPQPSRLSGTPTDQASRRISHLSQLNEKIAKHDSLVTVKAPKDNLTCRCVDFLVRTAPIWICLFFIIVVGFPVYFARNYIMPFEAFMFLLFWLLSLQLLKSLKTSHTLSRSPCLRRALVVLANPVLITFALSSAYLWIKVAYTGRSIAAAVTNFHRYDSFATGLYTMLQNHEDVETHLGAGDLASPILDAGIVCMGLKMFEYRWELWESCITVFMTSAIVAVVSVFINVLIAHAMGLQADEALAFAGRSCTIALGIPAIQNLGGNTAVMSALAVFSGILFQMTGDWMFSLMRINDRQQEPGEAGVLEIGNDAESNAEGQPRDVTHPRTGRDENDGSKVVAAGVTVGINAGAMGTAWLVERDSRATAYSALSMTLFGALTVAVTAPSNVETLLQAATKAASR